MDPLAWSALLLVLGLILVMVEVFVPSGGILGFLSIASLLAGGRSWRFTTAAPRSAFLFLAITAVDRAHGLGAGLSLVAQDADGPAAAAGRAHERRSAARLARSGARCGKWWASSASPRRVMLPSGAVLVDGQTIDALSEGMPIEAGQRVRVIEVRGNRVVVRPADDQPRAVATTCFRSRSNRWGSIRWTIRWLDTQACPLSRTIATGQSRSPPATANAMDSHARRSHRRVS